MSYRYRDENISGEQPCVNNYFTHNSDHTGAVLGLAMYGPNNRCYSGNSDGTIHCWTLPLTNIDLYDSYEPSVLNHTYRAHECGLGHVLFAFHYTV